jgi:hypothetical protein
MAFKKTVLRVIAFLQMGSCIHFRRKGSTWIFRHKKLDVAHQENILHQKSGNVGDVQEKERKRQQGKKHGVKKLVLISLNAILRVQF